MKVNQSFIFNMETEKVKMLEKSQFIKELIGIIAKKNNKVIDITEVKRLNNLSYKEIAEKYSNKVFTKLTVGIYCVKIDAKNILGCLIDKSIEDFKKIYEKSKNKQVKDKNNILKHELSHKIDSNKILNIKQGNAVTIDSLDEQIEANKIISNKLRNMEVNKMLVKNYVRKAAVVGIAAVAGMSLFACKKTEAPIPKADIRIDVDADISDGNKINEKEVIVKGKLENLSIKNIQGDINGNATATVEKDNETWHIRYKNGSIESINNEKGIRLVLNEEDKTKTVEQLINEINSNSDRISDRLNNNSGNVTITPEEAARGKTVENTRRTVNEYGVTIYGKPISEQEAINKGLNSEIGIKNDKKRGRDVKYTEYYSDAYGGKVYIATVVDTGGIEIFNEKGEKFLAGKKPQNDIEVGLANYRMGNAMAEAIDRTYNK